MGLLKENKIPAIILAGGKSSRFGKDKSRLKLTNKSLTYHQYKKLQKVFKKVYISSKKNKFDFQAPIIYDKQKEHLPILTLINLIQKFHIIFVIPVDVPLISIYSIKKLLKHKTITHSFLGIYDHKDLKKLKQNIKNNNFSPKIGKITINLKKEELINLNYKTEYKKYKQKIKVSYAKSIYYRDRA